MLSPLLALFGRALREDARAKSTYWARAGLAGLVLLTIGLAQGTMGWIGAPGLAVFSGVVFINLFFISLAGLSYFSSAITEEKEDMTLGLLRMTNLNPLSILLGKSASRQLGALLLLASQLPFTILAVSLGGVTLSQIFAAYACLAAYLVFLGNMALFFSVFFRRTAHAAILTGVGLAVFFWGAGFLRHAALPALAFFGWISNARPGPALESFLAGWEKAGPWERIGDILTTGFSSNPWDWQVTSNLALGLIFFLGAWAIFERCCREQADAAPPRGFLTKSGPHRRLFSPGRPWKHALVWKDFHFLGGGRAAVIGKLIGYGVLLGAILYIDHRFNSSRMNWTQFGGVTLWIMFVAFSVEAAFVVARVFRQERVWKTWSSLCVLPYTLRRIAWLKLAGCLLACWPAFFFLAIGGLLVAPEVFEGIGKFLAADDPSTETFSWIAITGILFSILQTLLFYHLIANLSLRLKWGALPLSIGIVFVGTQFMAGLGLLMFRQAAFAVLSVAVAVIIALLHVDIGNRLHVLAAED